LTNTTTDLIARADAAADAAPNGSFLRELSAELRKLKRERDEAAQQWQPIDTAPKTGRTLLLGYPNALGNWRTTRGQWMSDEYIAEYWEEPENGEAGWYETAVEAEDPPNCWCIEPTHWMPLPAPPTVDAAIKSGSEG